MQYFVTILGAVFLLATTGYAQTAEEFYGTTEPFAKEAIYFVLTDRFVDGDSNNNQVLQGGAQGTWQRRLDGPAGQAAFVGYMGGDFKGIYDHADYIKDLGFTAVWISPIVDNPDQAFTGGNPVSFGSGVGTDGGKTGYHGYWGVNFYRVDEHWESPGFSFQEFTRKMNQDHGLKIVLDIVANHGSPSWSMKPVDQPKFGEIYNEAGELIADHQNLRPEQLDPIHNPLHRFFNKGGNLAQLSDLNENNPQVLEYLVGAYLKWIEQGAAAFRIDTIAWMPHAFWKQFADRIRAEHPGFFMFGEDFNFDAGTIAQHQKPENGAISVLDFPGKNSITGVFQNPDSDYAQIQGYLHLTDCVYTNPYELATFYDNHDMARMNASAQGFIDAHNWLFTARGIPVLYYGSEMRFMAGKAEHSGNRNYYGEENINQARAGEIYRKLAQIGQIRKTSVALQKGLQVNIELQGQKAVFYRVYQKDGVNQTALVLLNKGSAAADFTVDQYVSAGTWSDAKTAEPVTVSPENRVIVTPVPAHDVKVLLFNEPVNHPQFIARLQQQMRATERCRLGPVTVSPDPLVAAQAATVHYYRGEPDQQIALHWGINNWNGISTPVSEDPMDFSNKEQTYTLTVELPAHATQFDFVFHNLTNQSWDNNGGRDWHYAVSAGPVPPVAPKALTAVPGDRAVTLTWEAVAGASAYTLYYTDDGTDPTASSPRLASTESRFIHQDLSNGMTYRYRVSASNAHGESPLSSEVVAAMPTAQCQTRLGEGAVLRLTGEAFADWNPGNPDYILHCVRDYQWEGRVMVPSVLIQTSYKLTLNGTWTVNWGGGAGGTEATLTRGGANASVTLQPGTYTLRVTEGTSVASPVQVKWIAEGEAADF